MKCLCFLAAALAITPFAAAQVTTRYDPTRDTFMRGPMDPPEFHGVRPNGRASKAFLDFYLADFDRAAIRAAIELQLGRPLTQDDMGNVELKWHLFSNNFQQYQPLALSRPAVFQGTQDWTEGDATFGASKAWAHYEGPGSPNNRRWQNRDGNDVTWFFNLPKVENTSFEEWGGEAFTYRAWTLEDHVEYAYLTDPLSLGLFLNASENSAGGELADFNNTEVYSRETTNLSRRPYLEVTVIPEPGAAGVIAAAAVALFRRRARWVRSQDSQ